MADDSYWYGSPRGARVSLYVPEGMQVPARLELVDDAGNPVTFARISAPLWCGTVTGVDAKGTRGCTSRDCHTRELGKCGCGRHQPSPGRPAVVLTPVPDASDGPPAPLRPKPRFDTR